MAVFLCPQCEYSQSVDDKHIGRIVPCPKCHTTAAVLVSSTPIGVSTPEAVQHGSHVVLVARRPRQEFFATSAPTLLLEYAAINDKRHPLQLSTACGVLPSFEGRRSVIDGSPSPNAAGIIAWVYEADVSLAVAESGILAFEINFLLFDIWGGYTGLLQAYEVKEHSPHTAFTRGFRWPSHSRRDIECHFASLAYVSRVKCSRGAIYSADTAFVVREAQRYAKSFNAEYLEVRPMGVA